MVISIALFIIFCIFGSIGLYKNNRADIYDFILITMLAFIAALFSLFGMESLANKEVLKEEKLISLRSTERIAMEIEEYSFNDDGSFTCTAGDAEHGYEKVTYKNCRVVIDGSQEPRVETYMSMGFRHWYTYIYACPIFNKFSIAYVPKL